jgi:hypothetical protein
LGREKTTAGNGGNVQCRRKDPSAVGCRRGALSGQLRAAVGTLLMRSAHFVFLYIPFQAYTESLLPVLAAVATVGFSRSGNPAAAGYAAAMMLSVGVVGSGGPLVVPDITVAVASAA